MMFPYPSAEGLHVGNLFAFTGNDIYGRFQRLQGHTVFEPLGFDAFGIHSENFALKVGTHPADLIPRNIDNFRRQLKRAGLMVDWRHELSTTDPRLLQVDAVALSAALQARPGVQEGARPSTGARTTRPSSPTSRSSPASASAAAPRSSSGSSSSGSSGSPTTPGGCSTTSTGSTGRSRPNRRSATGSAGPTAPRSASASRIWRSWPARRRPRAG